MKEYERNLLKSQGEIPRIRKSIGVWELGKKFSELALK